MVHSVVSEGSSGTQCCKDVQAAVGDYSNRCDTTKSCIRKREEGRGEGGWGETGSWLSTSKRFDSFDWLLVIRFVAFGVT